MNSLPRRRAGFAWAIVILFPIALNFAGLFGFLQADPVYRYANLTAVSQSGPLDIHPSFDPSVGLVFQPLGRRAADMLVHGRLPWWNSDQGIGAPLAGEMSPGAFYPLIFLELLPDGQTILDVAVQIFTGIFTLLLARRLGLGLVAGTLAAALFECNGTFAFLHAGWCYPIPCLPLLLYGIELCFSTSSRERIGGTILVALAIAVSISAAMLEVAFLNGLMGVAWAIMRIARARGVALLEGFSRSAAGAILGLLLAMPLLISFFDYLGVSDVGSHSGVWNGIPFDPVVLGQLFSPYILGTYFYHDSGYAGVALACFGICGLFGAYRRDVRIVLGVWIVIAVGATIGVAGIQNLFAAIPGVKYTAYNRYLDSSWELALSLLAAFYVYDLLRARKALVVRCCVATAIALPAYLTWPHEQRVADALAQPGAWTWFWWSFAWGALALAALWITATVRPVARFAPAVACALLLFEAGAGFVLPTLGLPVKATLIDGVVGYLRGHLGLQRFLSLGPIFTNYGSYFHVAALNDAELPVAKTWADYELAHLDTKMTIPGTYLGEREGETVAHLSDIENLGVRYIAVSRVSSLPLLDAQPFAKVPVYQDAGSIVFELPHPAPYFSAPGCVVVGIERDRAAASCAHPSTLRRIELFMPGWTATVNGTPSPVVSNDGLLQYVDLPAGSSFVDFSFVPPLMQYGSAAFVLALLTLGYQGFAFFKPVLRKPNVALEVPAPAATIVVPAGLEGERRESEEPV